MPLLSSEELEQVGRQSPPLRALITKAAGAPRGIGPLLRVPFNLRIAAELLDEDVAVDDLTPIETRLGLLERYWEHRVVRSDGLRDAEEGRAEACVRTDGREQDFEGEQGADRGPYEQCRNP